MKITRIGTTPSMPGAKEWFTGTVRIDGLFPADGGRRANAASVTFEPGAHTNWHTHPLGQTLLITQGLGCVQREGGPREDVRPGDVVFFEPGEKHWHGASATVAMSHIAIQEALEGTNVNWLEPVSDEQYRSELGADPALNQPRITSHQDRAYTDSPSPSAPAPAARSPA